jgi:predicted XRE-type DNA-binding protein
MAKPSGRAQQSKTVQEWIDNELRSDAQLRREVEETLNQMRIEQDLATLRERRQVSQSQLAKLLGVSQPAIAKLESGKAKNLELRTLVRYATVLGARVRVVIEEDAPRPKVRRVSRLAVVPARKAKAS